MLTGLGRSLSPVEVQRGGEEARRRRRRRRGELSQNLTILTWHIHNWHLEVLVNASQLKFSARLTSEPS